MRRYSGQVSIFLALSLLSILALLCGCLESARCACIDYVCGQAADSSLESVFAAYEGHVQKQFGLLLCRGRGGEGPWTDTALSYAEKYMAPGAGTLQDQGDRILLEKLEARDLGSVYITQDNGRVFQEAVRDYMQHAGITVMLKDFLARLGLYDENDGAGLLESLRDMIQDRGNGLDGILDNYKNIKEEAAKLQELAKQEAESYDTEYIVPAADSEDIKTDLLEQIKAIRKNGLIAVITGTEALSERSWDMPDMPSRLPEEEKNRNSGFAAVSSSLSLADTLLQGEYMIQKMGSYTQPEKGGGRYEAEYVLSGRKSDKASMEIIIGKILLIRMGLNLAYLSSDAEKMALAELTAIGIMSLLALPQLILILKWLLVGAWALAESILDVRALVRGKKVPLWKTSQSWKLSSMNLDLSADSGATGGLTYQDYLRILFYLGKSQTLSYRMMDVVDRRISALEPAFRLQDYMVYATVSLRAATSYLYLELPVINGLTHKQSRRYFSKTAAYGYGRR